MSVQEKFNGRKFARGQNATGEIAYLAFGYAEEADALTDVATESPPTAEGLVYIGCKTAEEMGGGVWEVVSSYALPEAKQKQPGDSAVVRFSTSGGTRHVTQSKQTRLKLAEAGHLAPDMSGAIGVTTDSVEGVDITVPVFNFEETWLFRPESINPAYVRTLIDLTGSMNAATFRSLKFGECLFVGVDGSLRKDGIWELTFKFAGIPNASDFKVGNINVIFKRGHDYLWTRYQKKTIGSGADTVVAQVPKYAYVEQVYDEKDFKLLGIGSP